MGRRRPPSHIKLLGTDPPPIPARFLIRVPFEFD